MPIYEYQCSECGHVFEQLQKISDDPLKICPECNAHALNKLISQAGFRLKGTGWYATDFKDNNKPKTDNSTSSNTSSDDSGSAKTESSASASTDSVATTNKDKD